MGVLIGIPSLKLTASLCVKIGLLRSQPLSHHLFSGQVSAGEVSNISWQTCAIPKALKQHELTASQTVSLDFFRTPEFEIPLLFLREVAGTHSTRPRVRSRKLIVWYFSKPRDPSTLSEDDEGMSNHLRNADCIQVPWAHSQFRWARIPRVIQLVVFSYSAFFEVKRPIYNYWNFKCLLPWDCFFLQMFLSWESKVPPPKLPPPNK